MSKVGERLLGAVRDVRARLKFATKGGRKQLSQEELNRLLSRPYGSLWAPRTLEHSLLRMRLRGRFSNLEHSVRAWLIARNLIKPRVGDVVPAPDNPGPSREGQVHHAGIGSPALLEVSYHPDVNMTRYWTPERVEWRFGDLLRAWPSSAAA